MCNVCNTNARNGCGNYYCNGLTNVFDGNGGCGWGRTNGYPGVRVQQVVHDCQGCLWIKVCGTRGCNGGTITDTTGNGGNGGGYGCFTLCGNLGNTATTTTTNGDEYYARQYGLCGRNRFCCGGVYY